MIFLFFHVLCYPLVAFLAYAAGRSERRGKGYQRGRRDGWNAAMDEKLERWDVEHRESTHRADL